MAVASYRVEDGAGDVVFSAVRNFHPPARACELKYWYRAVRKVLPEMEPWRDSFANGAFMAEDVIIMDGILDDNKSMSLTISRKKWMK